MRAPAYPLIVALCQQSKQEAEHTKHTVSKAPSASSPGQNSTARPIPVASSVAESGKGPRRRNRAERAALQQEHELLEQQKAKRSFR